MEMTNRNETRPATPPRLPQNSIEHHAWHYTSSRLTASYPPPLVDMANLRLYAGQPELVCQYIKLNEHEDRRTFEWDIVYLGPVYIAARSTKVGAILNSQHATISPFAAN